MSTLILLRHGQSTWNAQNLFTGWTDVDLTVVGETEATDAGRLMMEADIVPTVCHTSVLRRAIRTANLALDVCERSWVPVTRSWRLNERHYGGLQGLDKTEVREKYGDEQFKLWRRSYDVPPPPIERGSQWDNTNDLRYVSDEIVPLTECLADVIFRSMPYWYDRIIPDLQRNEVVLVVAHGNSLRAFVKHLDGISDADIVEFNLPTGVPRIYELDDRQRVLKAEYLGNPDEIAAKTAAVARQGQKVG